MLRRQMHLMSLFVLWALCNNGIVQGICTHKSSPWQPKRAPEYGDDLLCDVADCPESLIRSEENSIKRDKCCTCNSCMSWEGSEITLFIEYLSLLGRSLVISDKAWNKSAVYKVEHTHSAAMTEIPSNVCNWDHGNNLEEWYSAYFKNTNEFWESLVLVDFTGNNIRKIPDINCLVRLDKLILDDNNIDSLSNTSFINLTRLRVLSLERNSMKNIDPMIFTSPHLNFFYVNLGNNELQTIDASNMVSLHPFCIIEFNNNNISELVNVNNYKLDMSKTYGPGIVHCGHTHIQKWPNFMNLFQLDSWEQIAKLYKFGFNFKGLPISCDCSLEPFLSLSENIVKEVWTDYTTVKCTSPKKYEGWLVTDVPKEDFICQISQSEGCQSPECSCVDKPREDTLYVDCSNQNLDKLPIIPVSNRSQYVSLNVSGNHITQIANMSYLSKLKSLDISRNDLRDISDSSAKQLENCTTIDISDNSEIRRLPRSFQYRGVNNTRMKNLVIRCNCDTSWMETWLDSDEFSTDDMFYCDIPDVGTKPAVDFHTSDLECRFIYFYQILGSLIGSAVLTLIITSTLIYHFRIELLIIYLRLRHKNRNAVLPYKFDVFVSFNENAEHITKWVVEFLEPYLHTKGYSVFIALKHINLGAERNAEVIEATNNSRNFLIILSESYLQLADEGMRSWTDNEWKFGWNNFKQDRSKNIVLVNYDHMEPLDVTHPVIRAYLRVGCTVDFNNHNRDIMDDIEEKLGKPNRVDDIENPNKKFPRHHLHEFTTARL